MPYLVEKDTSACPANKPWAVKTEGKGTLHGCHATKAAARKQQAALYVNAPDEEAKLPEIETTLKRAKAPPESRAKYTAEQIEELGKKGQAYKNPDGHYSYPIADVQDLKNAIRAVGRGDASHNAIRKYIIKRAKALGKSALIPENWQADGSLKETKSVWETQEERSTYMDLRQALQAAVREAEIAEVNDEQDDDEEECCHVYIWIQDFTDEWVVYEVKSCFYKRAFAESDGSIILGAKTKVRPVTTYVETKKGENARLEWRRKRAQEMKSRIEHRDIPAENLEFREESDGTLKFTGYASLTNVPYEVGFYTETIAPGAFKRTLKDDPDVQLLVNHTGLPLARTKSGTMTLTEDSLGLKVEADLEPESSTVQELKRSMDRGDIDQMSFAFQALDQDWNEDFTERTLRSVNIHRGDVSVVNQAASPTTSATLRSYQALDALQNMGVDTVLEALLEWRDWSVSEDRAGKALSAKTTSVLTEVLALVASADEAVDQAQPILAELLGVANPDDGENENDHTGMVGSDGVEEPPMMSSATDGQRSFEDVLPDLEPTMEAWDFTSSARRQVELLTLGDGKRCLSS